MKSFKKVWLLFLIVFLVGCGPKTWQEHYDLGMKYLLENNYEEAILSFTAAIEIDPMQEDAYIYMAEAYQVQGDYEKALAILQQGYELLKSERLELQIELIKANEMLLKNPEMAEDFVNLYTAVKTEDRDQVAAFFEKYPYHGRQVRENMGFSPSSFAFDGEKFYLPEDNEETLHFIFQVEDLYYGKMQNGYPHGEGIQVIRTSRFNDGRITYYWIDGTWENGEMIGEAKIIDDFGPLRSEDNYSYNEINCVFGDEEIITSASVLAVQNWGRGDCRCTYHIENGKLLPSEWSYDSRDERYYRSCEVHSGCKFSVYELGTENYRNIYSFVRPLEMNSHGESFWGGEYTGGSYNPNY